MSQTTSRGPSGSGSGGRGRLLVFLRCPNSRGYVKSFHGQLTGSQLAQVTAALTAPG